MFSLEVLSYPTVQIFFFYWTLTLMVLKNVSVNRFTTLCVIMLKKEGNKFSKQSDACNIVFAIYRVHVCSKA